MKKTVSHPVVSTESVDASPNSCKVVATVTKIFAPDTTQKNSPCAKLPCTAMLKIKELKNCGAGASGMIDLTSEVEVNFAFTLAPSDPANQKSTTPLPGLKTGDSILASIFIFPAPGDKIHYTIYSYQLIKN